MQIQSVSFQLIALFASIVLLSDCRHSSQDVYLNHVLNIIQTKALRRNNVNWGSVRLKCTEMAQHARSTQDTYPAINYALSQLRDNHSFLEPKVQKSDKQTEETFSEPERVSSKNVLTIGKKKFGFIVVGEFVGDGEEATKYAATIQQQIADALGQKVSGWIVDLRGNVGGNMWPMLVGIGPVLGAGKLGYFVYPDMSVPWFYERGQAGQNSKSGRTVNFQLSNSISDCAESAPVAVLIDSRTVSSGEAVTISFKGRKNTRLFGQHSGGLSTANQTIPLPDGATLYLTTCTEADRNHVVYDSGVAPDEVVEQGDVRLGDTKDPCVRAAIGWLEKFDVNAAIEKHKKVAL